MRLKFVSVIFHVNTKLQYFIFKDWSNQKHSYRFDLLFLSIMKISYYLYDRSMLARNNSLRIEWWKIAWPQNYWNSKCCHTSSYWPIYYLVLDSKNCIVIRTIIQQTSSATYVSFDFKVLHIFCKLNYLICIFDLNHNLQKSWIDMVLAFHCFGSLYWLWTEK